MMFHNVSNYYYHLIIKESVEEFKEQFKCSGENIERYITLQIKKNRKWKDNNIKYNLFLA